MNKTCRICGLTKDITEYHKKKGMSDGHRNECKDCVREQQKVYKSVEGFKEKQADYDKQRYEENRDKGWC